MAETNPALILLVSAAVISMAVIPVMIRLAPFLGMIDQPSSRKVHSVPVSRVGGLGIVIGAMIPLVLWLEPDRLLQSYIFGSLVLLAFGAMDDARDLGHYVKFIGQTIAVVAVVYYGDLYVANFPLMADPMPPELGKPFTVFAMVGVINAINHSDGLDGLAGGEALLSLIVILYLSYLAGGDYSIAIAMVTIGGLFGFMRFNTHPARVFMGDSGSQFLGFTLGFLAVLLTQRVNPALSPAVVTLLIGLPVIDILAVLYLRVSGGMNWFRATRNHIHHRLLDLGFGHYGTVVIIYSIQTLMVTMGLLLRYQSDGLLLGLYVGVCVAVFALLTLAERSGWKTGNGSAGPIASALEAARSHSLLRRGPLLVVNLAIPLFLVGGAVSVVEVPRDFAVISAVLFAGLLAELLFGRSRQSIIVRGVVYIAAVFVAYLFGTESGLDPRLLSRIQLVYFLVLAAAVGLTIRYSQEVSFRTTPTDYLLVFIVLAVGVLPGEIFSGNAVATGMVQAVIIIYGCELLMHRDGSRWNALSVASLAALGLFAVRGILLGA